MTRKTLDLIAAPTALQPGGYVPKAYADRVTPSVASATLDVQRDPKLRRIRLTWSCPEAVREADRETDRFVDAAALTAPEVADAPWISMGAPGKALGGALWRADRAELTAFRAEGLGSVERQPPPADWKVTAAWDAGTWSVTFDLDPWPQLEASSRLAVAIWRGAANDRGGLKSISPGWVTVEP